MGRPRCVFEASSVPPTQQPLFPFKRMQRARERLEARRAAERTRRTESALRTRLANQEAEILQDISRMAPTDPPISTDPEVCT